MRIYAFDPSASLDMQTAVVNETVIRLAWDDLGSRLLVDFGPASGRFCEAVNLNDPAPLVQDGLPSFEGKPKFRPSRVDFVAKAAIKTTQTSATCRTF
jgi:hypothetical protein